MSQKLITVEDKVYWFDEAEIVQEVFALSQDRIQELLVKDYVFRDWVSHASCGLRLKLSNFNSMGRHDGVYKEIAFPSLDPDFKSMFRFIVTKSGRHALQVAALVATQVITHDRKNSEGYNQIDSCPSTKVEQFVVLETPGEAILWALKHKNYFPEGVFESWSAALELPKL